LGRTALEPKGNCEKLSHAILQGESSLQSELLLLSMYTKNPKESAQKFQKNGANARKGKEKEKKAAREMCKKHPSASSSCGEEGAVIPPARIAEIENNKPQVAIVQQTEKAIGRKASLQ
jgi:hypothetical protein